MTNPDVWLMLLYPAGILALALATLYFASSSR